MSIFFDSKELKKAFIREKFVKKAWLNNVKIINTYVSGGELRSARWTQSGGAIANDNEFIMSTTNLATMRCSSYVEKISAIISGINTHVTYISRGLLFSIALDDKANIVITQKIETTSIPTGFVNIKIIAGTNTESWIESTQNIRDTVDMGYDSASNYYYVRFRNHEILSQRCARYEPTFLDIGGYKGDGNNQAPSINCKINNLTYIDGYKRR